jgi:hypothetical protein
MTFKVKQKKPRVKKTFKIDAHLPIENTIYVPSTSGVKEQKKIDDIAMQKRVNEVRKYMSKKFGGYTSTKATGGFVLRDGKLVKEPVVKVTAFSSKQDFINQQKNLFNQVGRWKKKWKQESVSYEQEGDLFLIKDKRVKKVKK